MNKFFKALTALFLSFTFLFIIISPNVTATSGHSKLSVIYSTFLSQKNIVIGCLADCNTTDIYSIICKRADDNGKATDDIVCLDQFTIKKSGFFEKSFSFSTPCTAIVVYLNSVFTVHPVSFLLTTENNPGISENDSVASSSVSLTTSSFESSPISSSWVDSSPAITSQSSSSQVFSSSDISSSYNSTNKTFNSYLGLQPGSTPYSIFTNFGFDISLTKDEKYISSLLLQDKAILNGAILSCVTDSQIEFSRELRILGDCNSDGNTTAADALLILQHSVGKIVLEGSDAFAAELDSDNNITPADALIVLQYSTDKLNII